MTTAGWIFCAFCGVSVVISAAALVAMIFYVCSDKREERERIAARMQHPAPKPDAALELGIRLAGKEPEKKPEPKPEPKPKPEPYFSDNIKLMWRTEKVASKRGGQLKVGIMFKFGEPLFFS